MGTYSVKDAVTGQDIKEGEKMIGIFLSRDLTPESNKSKVGIFAYSKERYKMASLPIHGTWNGVTMTPDDPKSFAAFVSHECIGDSSNSVQQLMESMIHDSQRTYEGKTSSHFGQEPDTILEYSFMAMKASTLDIIKGLKDIKQYFGAHDPDQGLKQIDALKERFFEALDAYEAKDSNDKTDVGAMYRCIKLSKSIFFQNSNYENGIEGLPVPYAAKAMEEQLDNLFDKRVYEYFQQCGVGEFDGYDYLKANRDLPDYYPDMFKSVHEAQFIFDSMEFLDIPMQPTITMGGSYRSTAKLELMTTLLDQEVSRYIERCSDNMDMEEVKKIDAVLSPVKSVVAGLLRKRNDFEQEVKEFDLDND
jgi:hypothetical protein